MLKYKVLIIINSSQPIDFYKMLLLTSAELLNKYLSMVATEE